MEKSKLRELFTFEETDDPLIEDDQYVLNADEDLYIQVCDGSDYGGDTFYVVHRMVQIRHDEYGSEQIGEYKKPSDAMRKVIDLHKEGEG